MSKKISRRKREGYQIKHTFVHKTPVSDYERKEKEPQSIKNERSLGPGENYLKKDLKLFLILGIGFVIFVFGFFLLMTLFDFKIFNLTY